MFPIQNHFISVPIRLPSSATFSVFCGFSGFLFRICVWNVTLAIHLYTFHLATDIIFLYIYLSPLWQYTMHLHTMHRWIGNLSSCKVCLFGCNSNATLWSNPSKCNCRKPAELLHEILRLQRELRWHVTNSFKKCNAIEWLSAFNKIPPYNWTQI